LSKPRGDSNFHAPNQSGTGMPLPGDRVSKAVYLPNGDLVAEVIKRSVTDGVMRSSAYLEVFDPDLNVKATEISIEGFGQIQGAEQDGSLYFDMITRPNGIRIIKARLAGQ
jgi:hypothetical protein